MADGHAALSPGTGYNADTDAQFTNSESVNVQRTRVAVYGAGGGPGNGLAVNADNSITAQRKRTQTYQAFVASVAQVNAGTYLWNNVSEANVDRRGITIKNACDHTVLVYLTCYQGGAGGSGNGAFAVGFSVPAGGLMTAWPSYLDSISGSNTVASGDLSALGAPFYETGLFIENAGTAVTSGNVAIDYTMQS